MGRIKALIGVIMLLFAGLSISTPHNKTYDGNEYKGINYGVKAPTNKENYSIMLGQMEHKGVKCNLDFKDTIFGSYQAMTEDNQPLNSTITAYLPNVGFVRKFDGFDEGRLHAFNRNTEVTNSTEFPPKITKYKIIRTADQSPANKENEIFLVPSKGLVEQWAYEEIIGQGSDSEKLDKSIIRLPIFFTKDGKVVLPEKVEEIQVKGSDTSLLFTVPIGTEVRTNREAKVRMANSIIGENERDYPRNNDAYTLGVALICDYNLGQNSEDRGYRVIIGSLEHWWCCHEKSKPDKQVEDGELVRPSFAHSYAVSRLQVKEREVNDLLGVAGYSGVSTMVIDENGVTKQKPHERAYVIINMKKL